ncbi:multicopper oxidase family protein [Cryobacterium melibiosiphilum]|uniref:Multicopper oxidase family protein n=1 Tax=Cryobacterium melibiosiphilum TaxID=995039 RepID=A0A3A5MKX8_9MICO|nr:multicopper oxidase family protein [Cryobacterium melibiosiphilum]RJT85117.1 multicopper oxidase family protein [Cryobacterium melibiosiphilum]
MALMTRRNALILGGIGVAGMAIGGTVFAATRPGVGSGSGDPGGGQDFLEPAELRSTNGRLAATLTPARQQVTLAGRDVSALSYNGGVPGPTLRVRAGDTLSVSLRNGLTDPSNLHVHGLHVSPENNGDNMFVSVAAGDTFDYEYVLPANHPPGVYWYHPHAHGSVADQVFGGLYGAIIVEDPVPIAASRERVLVISDITFTGVGDIAAATAHEIMSGREGELVLVNGQLNPTLAARPGERERWRIVNACVSRYLRLRLDGQRMSLLAIDSGRFESAQEMEEIVLAPGNRADLLVTVSAGTAVLRSLAFDRGASGGMMGGGSGTPVDVDLATLTVAGKAGEALEQIPTQPVPRDLRATTVSARRELVFAMGMGGGMGGGMMSATINGRVFDASRIDTTVQFDSVEEWLLTNTSTLDHPLHLHVWPMQIVEEGGQPVRTVKWQDVVNVPANGSVRVRVAFEDFSGRSVYHCHILDHEDSGMMGVIDAYPPWV